MNVFFLSKNVWLCALLHADSHVIKMIMESVQLLYSVWTIRNSGPPPLLKDCTNKDGEPLKPVRVGKGHLNHPCAVWARHKAAHYMWLCRLGKALCVRKREIYGTAHSYEVHIDLLLQSGFPGGPTPQLPTSNIATEGIPPSFDYVALAGPTKYKNAVKAYRYYYATKIAESMLPKEIRTFKSTIFYNRQRNNVPAKLLKHVRKIIKSDKRYNEVALNTCIKDYL